MKKALIIRDITIVGTEIYSCKYEVKSVLPSDFTANTQEANKEYNPKPKDKIYFFPGCTVPRVKVRDWAKDKKIAVTIKPDKATVMVTNKKIVKNLSKDINGGVITPEQAKRWLLANGYQDSQFIYRLSEPDIDHVKLAVSYEVERKIGGRQYNHNGSWGYHAQIKQSIMQEVPNFNNYCWTDYVVDDKAYNAYISNSNKFYTEQAILDTISSEAAVIDKAMYLNLKNMLASQNHADKTMAIEIMGSCDYANSCHFILLLLKDHMFNDIRGNKAGGHVNFKSLLKYLGLKLTQGEISLKQITDKLIEKKLITLEVVKELAEYGKTHIINTCYDSGDFTIEKVGISDRLKNILLEQQKEKEEEKKVVESA